MQLESNIGFRHSGDFTHFAIAELTVKPKPNQFLLTFRKLIDQLPDIGECFVMLGDLIRACPLIHGTRRLCRPNRGHSLFPASNVKRSISTNRIQPWCQSAVQLIGLLATQPQKRVLHDITSDLGVADNSLRVANQVALIAIDRRTNPAQPAVRHPSRPGLSCVSVPFDARNRRSLGGISGKSGIQGAAVVHPPTSGESLRLTPSRRRRLVATRAGAFGRALNDTTTPGHAFRGCRPSRGNSVSVQFDGAAKEGAERLMVPAVFRGLHRLVPGREPCIILVESGPLFSHPAVCSVLRCVVAAPNVSRTLQAVSREPVPPTLFRKML